MIHEQRCIDDRKVAGLITDVSVQTSHTQNSDNQIVPYDLATGAVEDSSMTTAIPVNQFG